MTLTHRVQRMFGGSAQEGVYRCGNCDRRFERNRQLCPACDSYLIERTTYEDLIES